MGNIGRPSTGCGLCRKRRVKVSLYLVLCHLSFDSNQQQRRCSFLYSVTKVDLAAATVRDSINLVLDTESQAMALFERQSLVHQRTLSLKAVHHLCPPIPKHYQTSLCQQGQNHDAQSASVPYLVMTTMDMREAGVSVMSMAGYQHRDR
jgi:hypothetical protein